MSLKVTIYIVMLDKKSKILLVFVFTLMVLSMMATYWDTVVLRDFDIIDDLEEVELLNEDSSASGD